MIEFKVKVNQSLRKFPSSLLYILRNIENYYLKFIKNIKNQRPGASLFSREAPRICRRNPRKMHIFRENPLEGPHMYLNTGTSIILNINCSVLRGGPRNSSRQCANQWNLLSFCDDLGHGLGSTDGDILFKAAAPVKIPSGQILN